MIKAGKLHLKGSELFWRETLGGCQYKSQKEIYMESGLGSGNKGDILHVYDKPDIDVTTTF